MPVNAMPLSTKKAVLRNILIIGVMLIGLTAFSGTNNISLANTDFDYGEDTFIADESGYFTKTTSAPVSSELRTKSITHIVGANETISGIAALYGVKAQTIIWENNIDPNRIRTGEKIAVPPFDGVGYTVKSGDTASKIAARYKVPADDILTKNNTTELIKGEKIFVPNAKPIYEYRNTTSRGTSLPRTQMADNSSRPNMGKPFVFPTMGNLTQGFKRGHYAIDIANPTKPPVWAAADGTVIKAENGKWNGGYGNYAIIQHENGLQTLYGHLDYLSVSPGDKVKQGQVIGKMGRTGRVRGATGIHLHFEVINNGAKKVPSLYY